MNNANMAIVIGTTTIRWQEVAEYSGVAPEAYRPGCTSWVAIQWSDGAGPDNWPAGECYGQVQLRRLYAGSDNRWVDLSPKEAAKYWRQYRRAIDAERARVLAKSRTTLLDFVAWTMYRRNHRPMGSFPLAFLTKRGRTVYDRVLSIVGRAAQHRGLSARGMYLKWALKTAQEPQLLKIAEEYCLDEGLRAELVESECKRGESYVRLNIHG